MKLSEQIRIHRKKAGLTQEQIAHYLGVTPPAVNKWESGATFPDITLLAPLARLLKIDLNTLFRFRESLSREEIGQFCNEIDAMIRTRGFQAGFTAAEEKLQEYPACDLLRCSLAMLLDGSLVFADLADTEKDAYTDRLLEWYTQAANGSETETRESAIIILANKYLARGEIDKAQALADKLPDQSSTDKQMLKINILLRQERYTDAAVLAEKKLLGDLAAVQIYLAKLVDIDLLLQDRDAAATAAQASQALTKAFGFWSYNAFACPLQIALAEKDSETCLSLLDGMLKAAQTPVPCPDLFRHLPTKPTESDFGTRVVSLLVQQLETDGDFAFLRDAPGFQALIRQYK